MKLIEAEDARLFQVLGHGARTPDVDPEATATDGAAFVTESHPVVKQPKPRVVQQPRVTTRRYLGDTPCPMGGSCKHACDLFCREDDS